MLMNKSMGKKGRKSKSLIMKQKIGNISISILTPTIKSRQGCLHILAECISAQTYIEYIKEWVIVTADTSWNEIEFNDCINEIREIIPSVAIRNEFINEDKVNDMNLEHTDNYEAIGYLRNVTNWLSRGDYMVCMDDDDYYPPLRVEHSVVSLRKSGKMMAGCSGHYMYDADIKWIYQFRKLSNNHSVNNAMAYTREYLKTGAKYDSTKKHAEESSFLNGYATDMVQLKPEHTVLQMIHIKNTYNKRQLLVSASWASKEQCNMYVISKTPSAFIPSRILEKYRNALNYNEYTRKSIYDVVYYAGWGSVLWSPYDKKLGGSEQAIKHLVESWVSLGKKVAVYADFTDDVIKATALDPNQGDYLSYKDFKCSETYNTLILWRNYGSKPLLSWPLKADKIYLDIHDIVPIPDCVIDNLNKVTNVVVRSKFHAYMMHQSHIHSDIQNKLLCIPNGVRVKDFTPDGTVLRDPYRFVWCSCYTRGLENILVAMWPIIKQKEPKASFHIYYGMEQVNDENFKERMKKLLKQPGIIDHGRQSVDVIVKEKQTASYHLYYSSTRAETDCISIRESCVAGCIPIISKKNVFLERTGIHLDGDPQIKEDLINAAYIIVDIIKNRHDEIEKSRKQMIGKDTDWLEIASKWNIHQMIQE